MEEKEVILFEYLKINYNDDLMDKKNNKKKYKSIVFWMRIPGEKNNNQITQLHQCMLFIMV